MYSLRSNIVYVESDVIYSLITIAGTFLVSSISSFVWKVAKKYCLNIIII